MVSTANRRGRPKKNRNDDVEIEGVDGNKVEYEESRAQRIKENAEKMKSFGLFDLSKNLKVCPSKPKRKLKPESTPSNDPPRRSSRLKELPPVSYIEKRIPKKSVEENVEIHIEEGKNPEIYTEDDKELLGDSKAVWELYVDGFDEDGQRMYDPVDGKTCHQCRQKTLGLHSECCKCKLVTGQFCGDCLYMRYGENVKEVNENPDWVCPVCRGICNCSRCRRNKGWMPTGAIYNRVAKLGFKSVAHYLIYTRRGQPIDVAATDNPISADESLTINDVKEELTDALPMTSLVGSKKSKGEKDDMKKDSDEEYRGDEYEDDGDGSSSSSENGSQ
ncbi:hypothetical protein CASFOL_004907 [Castilleja foliolosa]|uniref:Zinc-finger domain-containing protein n=1 Tax=Castilleja foliolosa TaxID=1961234 RepID=A0ABD3EBX2_9LAMI